MAQKSARDILFGPRPSRAPEKADEERGARRARAVTAMIDCLRQAQRSEPDQAAILYGLAECWAADAI